MVTGSIDLKVRAKYLFIAPVLYIYRKAILRGLQFLKDVIREHYSN